MASDDPFDLQRFVDAQAEVWEDVRAELAAGRKRSHWMWFIFPQIQGLGSSETAAYYAISGREEARAFLGHAVLGARLRECCRLANAVEGRSAQEIFGYPDCLKFRSSLTLFARAAGEDGGIFEEGLRKYFGGEPDAATLVRL